MTAAERGRWDTEKRAKRSGWPSLAARDAWLRGLGAGDFVTVTTFDGSTVYRVAGTLPDGCFMLELPSGKTRRYPADGYSEAETGWFGEGPQTHLGRPSPASMSWWRRSRVSHKFEMASPLMDAADFDAIEAIVDRVLEVGNEAQRRKEEDELERLAVKLGKRIVEQES